MADGEQAPDTPLGARAAFPTTCRSEANKRAHSPAPGEIESDPAAEAAAAHVRGLEAGRVHGAFDAVGKRAHAGLHAVSERLALEVPTECRCEHIVPLGERREHRLPHAPGVAVAVYEHERLTGAAAEVGAHGTTLRRLGRGWQRGQTSVPRPAARNLRIVRRGARQASPSERGTDACGDSRVARRGTAAGARVAAWIEPMNGCAERGRGVMRRS